MLWAETIEWESNDHSSYGITVCIYACWLWSMSFIKTISSPFLNLSRQFVSFN